jgi:hypothetical protein
MDELGHPKCEQGVLGGVVTLSEDRLFSETNARDPGLGWGGKSPRSLVELRNSLARTLGQRCNNDMRNCGWLYIEICGQFAWN